MIRSHNISIEIRVVGNYLWRTQICRNFCRKFQDFSANFCNFRAEKNENSVIICHFPQFRQNSVKFAAKNDKFAEKSAKFCKNTENLKKIVQNNAKISKILKIQLVNLVDLEKCEKMSLLSHSEASIQPIFDPEKLGSVPFFTCEKNYM